MPTSDNCNLTPFVNALWQIRPKSVLDLGVGWGKFGVLVREYTDIMQEHISRETWQTTIVGVEGFAGYKNPIHDYVYDEVRYEDFTKGDYRGYDLVLMIDSLEHVEKAAGMDLLSKLILNNKHVVVSCPVTTLPQGAVNGNEFETHKAQWDASDFRMLGGRQLNTGVCNLFHFQSR